MNLTRLLITWWVRFHCWLPSVRCLLLISPITYCLNMLFSKYYHAHFILFNFILIVHNLPSIAGYVGIGLSFTHTISFSCNTTITVTIRYLQPHSSLSIQGNNANYYHRFGKICCVLIWRHWPPVPQRPIGTGLVKSYGNSALSYDVRTITVSPCSNGY